MSNSGSFNKLLAKSTFCSSPPERFDKFFSRISEILVSFEISINSFGVDFLLEEQKAFSKLFN